MKRMYPGKCMEDEMSYYSLYYTDVPLPAGVAPNLSLLVPLNFASRDEALKAAFKLIYKGAVVWKIESPQGLKLDRADIEKEYLTYRTT